MSISNHTLIACACERVFMFIFVNEMQGMQPISFIITCTRVHKQARLLKDKTEDLFEKPRHESISHVYLDTY